MCADPNKRKILGPGGVPGGEGVKSILRPDDSDIFSKIILISIGQHGPDGPDDIKAPAFKSNFALLCFIYYL